MTVIGNWDPENHHRQLSYVHIFMPHLLIPLFQLHLHSAEYLVFEGKINSDQETDLLEARK